MWKKNSDIKNGKLPSFFITLTRAGKPDVYLGRYTWRRRYMDF